MTQQFTFIPATKEQARLRLAIFGPSGSGKTFTSLRLATGLGGKIAFIDTERGSASKYADRFHFDVLELEDKDIDTYCTAIVAAQHAGYNLLIIDSLTHAWHELLGEVETLARAKYRGNTWSAWSEGTPKQRRLVDAILSFDGHIIATMRTKTEWTVTQTSGGKTQPVRVGLAPEQGKGIEYEFDLLMELSTEHIGCIIKDRTGRYQDQVIKEPGEALGEALAAWLQEGEMALREQRADRDSNQKDKSQTRRQEQPKASNGQDGDGNTPHWIEDPKVRRRFWKWTRDDLGLGDAEVHEALNVEHVADFDGTMQVAKACILAWVEAAGAERDNAELATEELFDVMAGIDAL